MEVSQTVFTERNVAAGAAKILIDIRGVNVSFGAIKALKNISFSIEQGKIVGLIGPNGAGKTTLFNCLSRMYTPSSGDIVYKGRSLLKVPRHKIAEAGIGRTFQNVSLFDGMDVQSNILVGGHVMGRSGFIANAFKPGWVRREAERLEARASELMKFMRIDDLKNANVADLPFPTRKRVELARALMMEPDIILLDEPAAGLNHEEVETLKSQIREIRDRFNLTVLLVEHHMNLVMTISDKVVAIDFGKKIAEGTPDEVQQNRAVIDAYLGAGA